MVHPLVCDNQRPLHMAQMGHGILCQNGKAVGSDQLRNAVVDLRIHMVGTSGQNDAVAVVFL